MNVLFIYTNINGFHENCYSFGLASIVSMTRANGHKARVLIVRKREEYPRILEEISSFGPQVVGFSSVSSQFHFVKEIAALIKKKYPDIINVCGGVHPTINHDCILESNSLDGIFVGESENSFIEFLQKIESGKSFKSTDNLAYAQNNRFVLNKIKPLIDNLDELPYPDREVYPFEDNLNSIGYASFFFSRGCPYFCSYCSNHAIAKIYKIPCNSPRYRSPESSIREIKEVIGRFRINAILIGDDIFGLDKAWREEFLERYKKTIKIRFFCLLRANLIDERFVRLLKDARCFRIEIGIESGNEYVRNDIMNRRMSNKQIIKAFDIVHKFRIQTNAINIIGVPEETEEMIWDTIKLNRRVRPTTTSANIFYPYKGTKLGDYCFEKGLVSESLYRTFSNERRETILSYPAEYKKKLVFYRKNWEALVYPFDFKRGLLRFARKTPIWKYLRILKRYIISRAINVQRKISYYYSDKK